MSGHWFTKVTFNCWFIISGDALFHHGNTLHHSAPNTSDRRRWAFMSCFNRADNSPILDNNFPKYTPLKKVRGCRQFFSISSIFSDQRFTRRSLSNSPTKIFDSCWFSQSMFFKGLYADFTVVSETLMAIPFEPRHAKTCLRGFSTK